MLSSLPPGLELIVGALLLPLLRGRARKALFIALPALTLAHVVAMPLGATWGFTLFGLDVEPLRVDALARIFAVVFCIAALLAAIYSAFVSKLAENVAALAYAGSAIAGCFAGDLISLFVFWELTALTSVVLVWSGGTERARRAGLRYLLIHVASGVLLLGGAAIRHGATGSIAFDALGRNTPGGLAIFLAFGIKAAFPFLHNWLQDSYPESTVGGTVFLSVFTTKFAIYALARGFAGDDLLVPIGATMTVFPVFYAVIENDLRRVLSYSLNNQLGFMVTGIGIGTELSLNGTVSHAFAHVIYKSLLFMSMGAVLFRTGTAKASELGGLRKTMPLTAIACMIGSASISGLPLFSGFVSKSMILTAALEEHRPITFFALLFASAGVVDHSGIKIPFFSFFAHDSGKRPKEAPRSMLLAMGLAAALCIGVGLFPSVLCRFLPHAVDYAPYTVTHVVETLQLLLFAALAFAVLMRVGVYPPELPAVNVDFDWVYRRAAPRVIAVVGHAVMVPWELGASALRGGAERAWRLLRRVHSPDGALGEPWPTGDTVLWVAILLAGVLLLYHA